MSSQILPAVTVVIPARDEEEAIGELLDALAVQIFPPGRVIVVDASSSDGTRKEAEARAECFKAFSVLESPGAYPGKARNAGAKVVETDWVVFIDCGIRIGPDCLKELILKALATKAEAISGSITPETPTLYAECSAIAYVPVDRRRGRFFPDPTVQMLLIRKALFDATGGFPEGLRSSEDLLFLRELERLGINVLVAPNAVGYWQLAPSITATFYRFRTYSLHNLLAGLWREWQLRVWSYYIALILLSAVVGSMSMQPQLSILPLGLFLSFRAVKALWLHRDSLPGGLGRLAIRFLLVAVILGIIDLATLAGTWDYLCRRFERRCHKRSSSEEVVGDLECSACRSGARAVQQETRDGF